MPLTKKLQTLNVPALKQVTYGNAKTIAVFWDRFVAPLLPDSKVVKDWFNLLNKFVDDTDAVLAIRCYFSWKHPKLKDSDTLRRGFYNLTDKDYTFFYTDNFFAAYFAKMAIDGYVPSYNDFKQCLVSREFPARFGPSSSLERDKAAYSIDGKKGKDPGFCANGYKIAHIVDAGKDFCVAGQTMTIGEICEKYCDRGDYTDWVLHNDQVGDFYARDLQMDKAAKDLLIAHFLRFACPMNYILTPGRYHHLLGVKIKYNDIAECKEIQQYAMHKFYAIYGQDYEDFLKRILLPSSLLLTNLPSEKALGKKNIDITFDYKIKQTSTSVKIIKSIKKQSNKKNMLIEQSKDKNDLRDRLNAFVNRPNAFVSPLKIVSPKAHENFLYKNMIDRSAWQYFNWLDPFKHPELDDLLFKHGIKGSIYTCTDLKQIAAMFDDLVDNISQEAQKANKHQNMVSAVRHFIEHLLKLNNIKI